MEETLTLGDIRSILRGTTTDPSDAWNSIICDATSNTVVIVAISRSRCGKQMKQAGTGTLVFLEGAHYILTATHVWDTMLVDADELGFTIRTGRGMPNTFSIAIRTMRPPIAFPRDQDCEEWGPDLALLRIPDLYVGTIEAFRSFYNMSATKKILKDTDHLETWMLCGAPAVLGTSSETEVYACGRAFQVELESVHRRDGFDFVDVLAHWPSPSDPVQFGGVSGGGLWKLLLYTDRLSNKSIAFAPWKASRFTKFPFRRSMARFGATGLRACYE
jgi:hypothetical protein